MMRTHTCGELTKKAVGKKVELAGWVNTRRDHGGVIFIDLRDRHGLTQIVFDPRAAPEAHRKAEKIGREWVLQVAGVVRERPAGMANPKLPTGDVEVLVEDLTILNMADTPPIDVDDYNVASEDMRLTYRYLDLRRPTMQQHLLLRHKAAQATRAYLGSQGFMEIETPMFVKTTPGGARVFKVPSRVHPGKFFALPESPQMYKQLLMVSGCDRYFQLARCMRDEDLRADRQMEFTQIDLEMSFIGEKDIQDIVEGLLKKVWKDVLNVDIPTPFQRITFHDAMMRFGSDKPDLRFGLEFVDVSHIMTKSEFSVFKNVLDKGGKILCLNAKKANFTRKEIDELTVLAKEAGLPGLAWIRVSAGKKLESSVVKYLSNDVQAALAKQVNADEGDILFFSADTDFERGAIGLGVVRSEVGKRLKLIKEGEFRFCWLVDVPLFEKNPDTGRWQARHHIFTSPKDEHIDLLEKDPGAVLAKAYDVVLNGVELGGGSIRIHRKDVQSRTLQVTGLTYEEAQKKFDFLLRAFQYGAPPHGGIAIGFDRLCALLLGIGDIREVIAFPRTKAGENLMDSSPQEWTADWLKELHLKTDIPRKEAPKKE
jgi:aspartyl-tRNA synthetase